MKEIGLCLSRMSLELTGHFGSDYRLASKHPSTEI